MAFGGEEGVVMMDGAGLGLGLGMGGRAAAMVCGLGGGSDLTGPEPAPGEEAGRTRPHEAVAFFFFRRAPTQRCEGRGGKLEE